MEHDSEDFLLQSLMVFFRDVKAVSMLLEDLLDATDIQTLSVVPELLNVWLEPLYFLVD